MYEDILNLEFYKGEDLYSDGDIEDRLLELCESGRDMEEILQKSEGWELLYHLSDIRENVLDWYEFDREGTVLEIGAGCGAVTGLFCRKTAHVTAIDLSKRRSTINAARNGKYGNLEILVGNFEDIKIAEKFDYVTLIGVLEYSGSYISREDTAYADPYVEMLKRAGQFLKPGGKLIIAIENKFGLKYFAGAAEDHTGGLFDGIENYSGAQGVRTFSKPEITRLLDKAGFPGSGLTFYYPMPDYKLPDAVYSDEFLPRPGMLKGTAVSYDRERYEIFDQETTFDAIVEDGQFPYFANSFLIFAGREASGGNAAVPAEKELEETSLSGKRLVQGSQEEKVSGRRKKPRKRNLEKAQRKKQNDKESCGKLNRYSRNKENRGEASPEMANATEKAPGKETLYREGADKEGTL